MLLAVGVATALFASTAVAGAPFAIVKVMAGVFVYMFLMVIVVALFARRAA